MKSLFSNMTADRVQRRVDTLSSFGARGADVEALLSYNRNDFKMPGPGPVRLPLSTEASAEDWRTYVQAAERQDTFQVLRDRLVQLRFPIREGISETASYRRATRALDVTDVAAVEIVDGGLKLQSPGDLRLHLHSTPAGDVPVIVPGTREDFVSLFRALLKKNEPTNVPDAMGAVMVSGYPNWSRLHDYRHRIAPSSTTGSGAAVAAWLDRFREESPDASVYKDRFILLSSTPYSAVPAGDVGREPATWAEASVAIRRAHETAHFVTRRLLGSMRNVLHDEIIADYMGITAVEPTFRADWFLRFLGLERAPAFRASGRLSAYRGDPSLSDSAFSIVQRLAVAAADTVESVDAERNGDAPNGRIRMMLAIAALTVEELAATDGKERLTMTLKHLSPQLRFASEDASRRPVGDRVVQR